MSPRESCRNANEFASWIRRRGRRQAESAANNSSIILSIHANGTGTTTQHVADEAPVRSALDRCPYPKAISARLGTASMLSVTSALSNELYAGIGRLAEFGRTQGGWQVTRRVNRVIDGSPEPHQILARARRSHLTIRGDRATGETPRQSAGNPLDVVAVSVRSLPPTSPGAFRQPAISLLGPRETGLGHPASLHVEGSHRSLRVAAQANLVAPVPEGREQRGIHLAIGDMPGPDGDMRAVPRRAATADLDLEPGEAGGVCTMAAPTSPPMSSTTDPISLVPSVVWSMAYGATETGVTAGFENPL